MHTQLHIFWRSPINNHNRDELQLPKRATINGEERPRISSQAIKSAVRYVLGEEQRGTRTMISTLVMHRLIDHHDLSPEAAQKLAEPIIAAVSAAMTGQGAGGRKKSKAKVEAQEDDPDEGNKDTEAKKPSKEVLTFLSAWERRHMEAYVDKCVKRKAVDPLDVSDFLSKTNLSPDIAMFGRMFTPPLRQFSVTASVQISHAITVNRGSLETDFFTGMNDLDRGEHAAHLGEKGFSGGGVYYLYVSINNDQLMRNLGNDQAIAGATVESLVRALMTAGPTGSQASYASRVHADYVMIERGACQPFTEQGEFDRPAAEADPLAEAIRRFRSSREAKMEAYGYSRETMEFDVRPAGAKVKSAQNLAKLLAFAGKW